LLLLLLLAAATQAYILHCPDCDHVSPELLSYGAVQQHAQQHLSTARHSTDSRLACALAAGVYSLPEVPLNWPVEPLSTMDDVIQQLLVRVAIATAVFITVNTRKAARVPTHPHVWAPKKKAAAAAAAAAAGSSAVQAATAEPQLLQPLLLRGWATALLDTNKQALEDANWARPSLERLDRAADPDRPPASLLDLILAPPFVGVDKSYHAGGGLSKLAALIVRKRKEKVHQGPNPRQRKQQQPQSHEPATQQGAAGAAAGTAAGAEGSSAAGSGSLPSLNAVEVLSTMLSDDPLFEDLPAEQRLPAFLQLAQVGNLDDIEAATTSQAFVSFNHMAMCASCGTTAARLQDAKLSSSFRKCGYCCAAYCNICCKAMQDSSRSAVAAAAGGGGILQAPAATAAGAAAAGPSAAGQVQLAAQAVSSAAWPHDLCPWCVAHPDTEHIRQGAGSAAATGHSRQQQQHKQKQPRRAAAAAAAANVRIKRARHSEQPGGPNGGLGTDDDNDSNMREDMQDANPAARPARTAAAAGGAAASSSERGFGPHFGQLPAQQVAECAAKIPMTDAQKDFLCNKFRAGQAARGTSWWLMEPGAVRDVAPGFVVLRVSEGVRSHMSEVTHDINHAPTHLNCRSLDQHVAGCTGGKTLWGLGHRCTCTRAARRRWHCVRAVSGYEPSCWQASATLN